MKFDKKKHWELVYETKDTTKTSWAQPIPHSSLKIINSFGTNKNVEIIDVGGGDSKLVDFLLSQDYKNITVLDISAKSIEKAKERLRQDAKKVTWITSDILEFEPEKKYDIWHDRATFHFLRSSADTQNYSKIVNKAVKKYFVVATFSLTGPTKCSGLEIQQQSKESLRTIFTSNFNQIDAFNETHKTPSGKNQNFVFCSFKKK